MTNNPDHGAVPRYARDQRQLGREERGEGCKDTTWLSRVICGVQAGGCCVGGKKAEPLPSFPAAQCNARSFASPVSACIIAARESRRLP